MLQMSLENERDMLNELRKEIAAQKELQEELAVVRRSNGEHQNQLEEICMTLGSSPWGQYDDPFLGEKGALSESRFLKATGAMILEDTKNLKNRFEELEADLGRLLDRAKGLVDAIRMLSSQELPLSIFRPLKGLHETIQELESRHIRSAMSRSR
ncbi:hypothetical protein C8Q77DRAFT_475521 [Trametes polyzona]|nr:hypothetical protein C8Q77DRAFT_475521 [Trametes polyzona]